MKKWSIQGKRRMLHLTNEFLIMMENPEININFKRLLMNKKWDVYTQICKY